jgi:hypothetical protein
MEVSHEERRQMCGAYLHVSKFHHLRYYLSGTGEAITICPSLSWGSNVLHWVYLLLQADRLPWDAPVRGRGVRIVVEGFDDDPLLPPFQWGPTRLSITTVRVRCGHILPDE